MSVIIFGHVNAGKSTLVGQLLKKTGVITSHEAEQVARTCQKGSELSALSDISEEERQSGNTVDINRLEIPYAGSVIRLIDTPGHQLFIPAMIAGCETASLGLWMISAKDNEWEVSIEQSLEHLLIVRGLGITQLIIGLNKIDTVPSYDLPKRSAERVAKKLAFRDIRVAPISAYHDVGLDRLLQWLAEPTVADLRLTETVKRKTIAVEGKNLAPLLVIGKEGVLYTKTAECRGKLLSLGSKTFCRANEVVTMIWELEAEVTYDVGSAVIIRDPVSNKTVVFGKILKM